MDILQFGSGLDQNSQFRGYMEDEIFIEKQQNLKYLAFGLFDGHGGDFVSKNLKQAFPEHFKQILGDNTIMPDSMNTLLKNAFEKLDKTFEHEPLAQECGSTGIVGFLYPDPLQANQLLLSIGNIGDSSAYLFDEKLGYRLSFEHKASDLVEKKRIEDGKKGQIFFDRVQGVLAITRAFGDFSLKQYGVISEPWLYPEPIQLKKQYEFMVIASDGIWDAYTTQEKIMEMASQLQQKKNKTCQEIAQYFLQCAKQAGSRDNLSIIVIKLQN